MSLIREEGLSCIQVVVGGVQTHLSCVGGVYPSFYLAGDRERKIMFLRRENNSDVPGGFKNVYTLPLRFNHQFLYMTFSIIPLNMYLKNYVYTCFFLVFKSVFLFHSCKNKTFGEINYLTKEEWGKLVFESHVTYKTE